jgi:hypothetical protein
MQTQANSPFTSMTQIAYTPGPWIGAAPTGTPTLPTTSTSTPIPQGQRIETYNNALTGIDILRGGWNYFSQHIDIAAPNPIIGFVRGAYVQATQDIDSGNFIGPEILLRSGVSGLEGAATDVVSTGGGLAGGGAGLVACSGLPICGGVGYIIGAGSTYVAVDNAFNQVNERWLFPFIHNAVNGD